MVAIDATTLLLFLQPDTPGPTDAEGKPLPHARERVEYLIERLDAKPREMAGIPVVRTRDLELPPGLGQTDLFSEDEGTP